MAETQQTTTQKTEGGQVVKETITREYAALGSLEPTKAYKVKAGARLHTHGQLVNDGDTIQLTRSQASAFRDKIEAVDDGDFKVQDAKPYQASAKKTDGSEQKISEKGREQDAKPHQGAPLPQPPVLVVPRSGAHDPNGPPLDPTVLDPARQGQQSREQRDMIDDGRAPLAKQVTEKPKSAEELKNAKPGTVTGAPPAGTPVSQPPAGGTPAANTAGGGTTTPATNATPPPNAQLKNT